MTHPPEPNGPDRHEPDRHGPARQQPERSDRESTSPGRPAPSRAPKGSAGKQDPAAGSDPRRADAGQGTGAAGGTGGAERSGGAEPSGPTGPRGCGAPAGEAVGSAGKGTGDTGRTTGADTSGAAGSGAKDTTRPTAATGPAGTGGSRSGSTRKDPGKNGPGGGARAKENDRAGTRTKDQRQGQGQIQDGTEGRGPLTRSPRQKVVSGVCAGLGRYCDVDPIIFRIVIGVLSIAGGLGMIFYGLAWLLIPADGEEENEARKLLSGRVEGSALVAVLLALIGCGLFLSMLGNGGTLSFAVMLTCAVIASAVYAKHRRETGAASSPVDPAAVRSVSDAPPETQAPPVPGSPSWWRDPIVKDGTTGHYAYTYIWGPEEEPQGARRGRRSQDRAARWAYVADRKTAAEWRDEPQRPPDVGAAIFFVAVGAGALGTWLSWHTHPLGPSLQIGLAATLAVLGLGLAVTAFVGRARFGTVFLAILTTILLAAATALPDDISTHWRRQTWRPTDTAAVAGSYRLGSGVGTLDLRGLKVPAGTTVRTSAHVGGGRLHVFLPSGTALDVRAGTTAGAVRLPGDSPDELHIAPNQTLHRTYPAIPEPDAPTTPKTSPGHPAHPADPAKKPGTLALTLDVGLGEVEVTRAAS